MKKLSEKLKELLDKKKLEYWTNNENSSYRIPFIYETNHERIKDIYESLEFPIYKPSSDGKIMKRVVIDIDVSNEDNVLGIGFVSALHTDKLGTEGTMMQLLKFNTALQFGRVGIMEDEKHIKTFSLQPVPQADEINPEEFEKRVQLCIIVNDILTDAGFIELEVVDNGEW